MESVKAAPTRKNKMLLIAAAALGLLLYTAGVCASAVFVDRRVRQADEEPPRAAASAGMALPMAMGSRALQPGEKIIAAGECEFTVTDCAYSRQIFPPWAGRDCAGYEAGNAAEGYVDLTIKFKNLNDNPADIDAIASPVLACAGGDEYGAFAVIESTDGSRFVEVAQVAPGGSEWLHYLFLVPKEVGEGAFSIAFVIAGQEYTMDFAAGFEEP